MGDDKMTLVQFFQLGGVFMWPLLIFSIATVALILERTIFLLIHNLKVKDIFSKIIEKLDSGDLKSAEEICAKSKKNKVSAPIFLEAIKMAQFGEHRMEKCLEAEASKKINDLERGLNFLVALGSLAPITGFLGTVSGMITAFRDIANAADINAQLVANGIFEALITTAFGLTIAILAVAAYNIFTNVVDNFAKDVEQSGSDIISSILFSQNKK
ncbi:MAG: MotA/TolQ/ExbB proton channel family protein [Spirochaetes bacterium]|nr:MotA/TolQ/ExbB proton channel family protein [Spirochaetota bacterium]